MKPLTIEQLRSLKVGDWVWIINSIYTNGAYVKVDEQFSEDEFYYRGLRYNSSNLYSTYGSVWKVYKNKEQAEAKEQCVICHKDISKELPKVDVYGNHYCYECYSDKCEKELLQERKAKGEIVKLPCKVRDKAWYVVNRGKFSTIVETYVENIVFYAWGFEITFEGTSRHLTYESNGTIKNSFNIYLDKAEAERRLANLIKE